MRRRDFISGIAGSAIAWPLAARAQQATMPVIGYLSSTSRESPSQQSFVQGLSEAGYSEGRNIAIEYRWAEGHYDRLPALANDLVDRRVAVIAATPSPAALAAKAATTTIPIVFSIGADPIQWGLVPRLNRPGGNVTGSSYYTVALTAKRLEFLLELTGKVGVVALLSNPTNAIIENETKEALTAAASLGQRIEVLRASTATEIDAAFAALVKKEASALLLGNDGFFFTRRNQIALLAARHAIPAIYPLREYVEAGGLMSYGSDQNESHRQQGNYVGRVLKGEKAADLPVLQPTRFELVVNLAAARTIGLEVTQTILTRADEVIE